MKNGFSARKIPRANPKTAPSPAGSSKAEPWRRLLPAKKFGLNRRKRSWYDFVMKRNLFVLLTTLTMFLAGCGRQELTVDMSKTVTDTNAPPVNLSAEIARAKSENKLLLLEFGSSDSCPPCVLFQQKVFSSPEFLAYEKSNLDFVRLDYPAKA